MRWGAWLCGVLGALLIAAPAQAGTYVVRACNTPAGFFPNLSWSAGVDRYFNGRGTCSKPPDDVATEIWPNGAAIPPGRPGR